MVVSSPIPGPARFHSYFLLLLPLRTIRDLSSGVGLSSSRRVGRCCKGALLCEEKEEEEERGSSSKVYYSGKL